MVTRTGSKSRDTEAGFTLVELLLAVVLVLLLLGAMIFNFSGLPRGAALDEGANQVEALIRFARAQAAQSGRQVQLAIQPASGDGPGTPSDNVHLLWEPDPVARPGLFEPLQEAAEYVRGISDRVRFEQVQIGDDSGVETKPANNSGTPDDSAENIPGPSGPIPLVFYPDGSSDSALIILAPREENDRRRIRIQLRGVTGSIRRNPIDVGPDSPNPLAFAQNVVTSNPARVTEAGR